MEIKFDKNYNNKLNCKIFTTIRNDTLSNRNKYLKNVGKTFDIILNKEKIKEVELIKCDVLIYCEIPDYLLVLDTGETNLIGINTLFEKFGMKNIYQPMLVLTLKSSDNLDKR